MWPRAAECSVSVARAGPALRTSLCTWLRKEHLQLPGTLAGKTARSSGGVCGVLGAAGLSWDGPVPPEGTVVLSRSECGCSLLPTWCAVVCPLRRPPRDSPLSPGGQGHHSPAASLGAAASGLGPACSLRLAALLACSGGTFPFSESRGHVTMRLLSHGCFLCPWGRWEDAEGSRRFTGSVLMSWGHRPEAQDRSKQDEAPLASGAVDCSPTVIRRVQASGCGVLTRPWAAVGSGLPPPARLPCSVSPATIERKSRCLPSWLCPGGLWDRAPCAL